MDILPPETNLLEEPGMEAPDEFSSGAENRVRKSFLRLLRWIFSPPYFPSQLIWFLAALITLDVALSLQYEGRNYWLDPGSSDHIDLALRIPLNLGPWMVLAIYAAYILLLSLILTFSNRRLALIIWASACIYHLPPVVPTYYCQGRLFASFVDKAWCSQWLTGILIIGALIWVMILAAMLEFGLFPFGEQPLAPKEGTTRRLPALIQYGSMVWIGLLVAGVGVASFPSKPTWKQIKSAHAPSARTTAGLAYDTQRSRAVLFGGSSAWNIETEWNSLDDTWEWDGNDWQALAPINSPSARRDMAMAYDESRATTLLFGGISAGEDGQPVFFGDTWKWDGNNWTKLTPVNSPIGRAGGVMYYDNLKQKLVLYGGYYKDSNSNVVFLDDLWEWDGQTWSQVALEHTRPNSASSAIFDPLQQAPLLIDGEGLWLLKDNRWFQASYPQMPYGRWESRLAFDAKHQQVILFGGYKDKDIFNDTWVFNGVTWNKLIMNEQPPVRNSHNLFYDQVRGNILLFGGIKEDTFYNDLWELVQP